MLPTGTVFNVIDNTAEAPIASMFANLPDGSTITIGNTTLQAGYIDGELDMPSQTARGHIKYWH